MKGFDPMAAFGPAVAARYDDEPRGDEDESVACLARLAGGGPALELAIGTGRVALPLAATGVRVDGIEVAQAMVDRLRAKPGGDALAVTLGDFADVPVDGRYPLVYLVFNTLFNLLTQDDQVRCFANVAEHLTDDGVFLVEAFVPTWLHRLRDDQYVDAERIEADRVTLDVGRHDPVAQILDESHVTFADGAVRVSPIVCRYAWPAELDLMARLAGLRLLSRYGGWSGEPFTATSRRHVSVWGRK
jgi:SAM-dependent methyltransferase